MSVLANNRSLNFETFAKTMQIIIARNLLIIERCLEVKRFSSILIKSFRTNDVVRWSVTNQFCYYLEYSFH